MKIRIQQINPIIGDIEGNLALISDALSQAEKDGMDLLQLPELAVSGYPPMDLLERRSFLQSIFRANREIVEGTENTAILFGTATENVSEHGRACYNSAIMAWNGEVLAEVHKTLLPTYDVYDELRYFEPDRNFQCVEFQGRKLGITVCEDIWYNNSDVQYVYYDVSPAAELSALGADAIFNVSASPYTRNKPKIREEMLKKRVRQFQIPVFYVNQVGGNTELVSDGDSMALDSEGRIVARAPLFEKAFIDVKWDGPNGRIENRGSPPAKVPGSIEQMFRGLVVGLRDYLEKTGVADQVVLGLSGGIDSALTACIAREALGAENVVGLTMPSEFSSGGSVDDSQKLAKNMGIKLHQLAIKEIYDEFKQALDPLFSNTSFGVAEENLQTRIRGILLMAYSNKFGHMLLNTGNKSELATGYCTLYGDMTGGLGVIADLYKTEVYAMARWLNEEYYQQDMIPESILEKPPSAELRPDQKDTDTLPDYDTLDSILKLYLEDQRSVDEIVDQGLARPLVEEVVSRVDAAEYKRYQAVPGLKVSEKAFGTGRRWPVVQRWTQNQKK